MHVTHAASYSSQNASIDEKIQFPTWRDRVGGERRGLFEAADATTTSVTVCLRPRQRTSLHQSDHSGGSAAITDQRDSDRRT